MKIRRFNENTNIAGNPSVTYDITGHGKWISIQLLNPDLYSEIKNHHLSKMLNDFQIIIQTDVLFTSLKEKFEGFTKSRNPNIDKKYISMIAEVDRLIKLCVDHQIILISLK